MESITTYTYFVIFLFIPTSYGTHPATKRNNLTQNEQHATRSVKNITFISGHEGEAKDHEAFHDAGHDKVHIIMASYALLVVFLILLHWFLKRRERRRGELSRPSLEEKGDEQTSLQRLDILQEVIEGFNLEDTLYEKEVHKLKTRPSKIRWRLCKLSYVRSYLKSVRKMIKFVLAAPGGWWDEPGTRSVCVKLIFWEICLDLYYRNKVFLLRGYTVHDHYFPHFPAPP